MERVRPPDNSISEFLAERKSRNAKIFRSAKSSGDNDLNEEAYSKTLAEVQLGVLHGPYSSMAALPLQDVALVPRRRVWEQHGGAVESSFWCIDDMLVGEQNSTVGTVSSHRPTDPDGLSRRSARCGYVTRRRGLLFGRAT